MKLKILCILCILISGCHEKAKSPDLPLTDHCFVIPKDSVVVLPDGNEIKVLQRGAYYSDWYVENVIGLELQ
jgi:hypothetical protein